MRTRGQKKTYCQRELQDLLEDQQKFLVSAPERARDRGRPGTRGADPKQSQSTPPVEFQSLADEARERIKLQLQRHVQLLLQAYLWASSSNEPTVQALVPRLLMVFQDLINTRDQSNKTRKLTTLQSSTSSGTHSTATGSGLLAPMQRATRSVVSKIPLGAQGLNVQTSFLERHIRLFSRSELSHLQSSMTRQVPGKAGLLQHIRQVREKTTAALSEPSKVSQHRLEQDLLPLEMVPPGFPRPVRYFLASEDQLLARGLETYGSSRLSRLVESVLPTKTTEEVTERFRYLTVESVAENPVKTEAKRIKALSEMDGTWHGWEDNLLRQAVAKYGTKFSTINLNVRALSHRNRFELRKRWTKLKATKGSVDAVIGMVDADVQAHSVARGAPLLGGAGGELQSPLGTTAALSGSTVPQTTQPLAHPAMRAPMMMGTPQMFMTQNGPMMMMVPQPQPMMMPTMGMAMNGMAMNGMAMNGMAMGQQMVLPMGMMPQAVAPGAMPAIPAAAAAAGAPLMMNKPVGVPQQMATQQMMLRPTPQGLQFAPAHTSMVSVPTTTIATTNPQPTPMPAATVAAPPVVGTALAPGGAFVNAAGIAPASVQTTMAASMPPTTAAAATAPAPSAVTPIGPTAGSAQPSPADSAVASPRVSAPRPSLFSMVTNVAARESRLHQTSAQTPAAMGAAEPPLGAAEPPLRPSTPCDGDVGAPGLSAMGFSPMLGGLGDHSIMMDNSLWDLAQNSIASPSFHTSPGERGVPSGNAPVVAPAAAPVLRRQLLGPGGPEGTAHGTDVRPSLPGAPVEDMEQHDAGLPSASAVGDTPFPTEEFSVLGTDSLLGSESLLLLADVSNSRSTLSKVAESPGTQKTSEAGRKGPSRLFADIERLKPSKPQVAKRKNKSPREQGSRSDDGVGGAHRRDEEISPFGSIGNAAGRVSRAVEL